jgi:hypothetical protein
VPRTPNPNGDPVAIRKKGEIYKVRYYPIGVISNPADRKELPRVFHTLNRSGFPGGFVPWK